MEIDPYENASYPRAICPVALAGRTPSDALHGPACGVRAHQADPVERQSNLSRSRQQGEADNQEAFGLSGNPESLLAMDRIDQDVFCNI